MRQLWKHTQRARVGDPFAYALTVAVTHCGLHWPWSVRALPPLRAVDGVAG